MFIVDVEDVEDVEERKETVPLIFADYEAD